MRSVDVTPVLKAVPVFLSAHPLLGTENNKSVQNNHDNSIGRNYPFVQKNCVRGQAACASEEIFKVAAEADWDSGGQNRRQSSPTDEQRRPKHNDRGSNLAAKRHRKSSSPVAVIEYTACLEERPQTDE